MWTLVLLAIALDVALDASSRPVGPVKHPLVMEMRLEAKEIKGSGAIEPQVQLGWDDLSLPR